MNPLSKIIRQRKPAKGQTAETKIEQQPADAPRALDEEEMKKVGGGGSGSVTSAEPVGGIKKDAPRGGW